MDRRAFMASAPIFPLGVVAQAEAQETRIIGLFREWTKVYTSLDHENAEHLSDEEVTAISDRVTGIEKQIRPMPCTCAADFAAKLIVESGLGDWALPGRFDRPEFWAEGLRALSAQ